MMEVDSQSPSNLSCLQYLIDNGPMSRNEAWIICENGEMDPYDNSTNNLDNLEEAVENYKLGLMFDVEENTEMHDTYLRDPFYYYQKASDCSRYYQKITEPQNVLCWIMHEDFDSANTNMVRLSKCGHTFCQEFIDKWLKESKITCPACNRKL